MVKERTLILNATQVQQKINRIAHEIYENHFVEEHIIIVGIDVRGYVLAERIAAVLTEIDSNFVELVKLTMNKEKPRENNAQLTVELDHLNNKMVILIDDVLNSGNALIYATNHLLKAPLKKLRTVVLVDRRHRKFPIRADYVGLTLSTTIQEHISVEFAKDNDKVYLE
jgi:pyrimidine operon attenuation protein/uracil phosphoribosyltransferase